MGVSSRTSPSFDTNNKMGAYGGDDAPIVTETVLLTAMKYAFILCALFMILGFQLMYSRQNGLVSWG